MGKKKNKAKKANAAHRADTATEEMFEAAEREERERQERLRTAGSSRKPNAAAQSYINKVLAIQATGNTTTDSGAYTPEARSRLRKAFGPAFVGLNDEQFDLLVTLVDEDSAAKKDITEPSKKKRMARMMKRWKDYVMGRGVPEQDIDLDTIYSDHGRGFIRGLVLSGHGKQEGDMIAYGTLEQYVTTFLSMCVRYAHTAGGERIGTSLLRGGLFNDITEESKAMFDQFKMTKYVRPKVAWGRFELKDMIEHVLGFDVCMESGIQKILAMVLAWVTLLRPGSLGYAHAEWNGEGENWARFAMWDDVTEINRNLPGGRGSFLITFDARHLKGRNGAKVSTTLVFDISSFKLVQNTQFEVANYLIPKAFFEKRFVDWVGKSYDKFLDGKDSPLLMDKTRGKDPILRKGKQSGYGLEQGPMSAQQLGQAVVQTAINAGLRTNLPGGGTFTSFRKDGAADYVTRGGLSRASEMLGHNEANTVANRHYASVVTLTDVAAIRGEEYTWGDDESYQRAKVWRLLRSPAVRKKAYDRCRARENTFDDVSEEDSDDSEH